MPKRIIAALLAAAVTSLCGCSISEFNADSLIRPPKITGDEAEIEELIGRTASGGYTLKYPKSGDYRSAITMEDLDADGVDEAIAFYCETDNTTEIHMLVMYSSSDSSEDTDSVEWSLSEDITVEAADVDRLEFADLNSDGALEILSGYTTYNANINNLNCAAYSNGETVEIGADFTYSSFSCADLDADGADEAVLLSLSAADVSAGAVMLKYDSVGGLLFSKSETAMDPNVVSYSRISVTAFDDGGEGVVIDGAYSNGELNTQALYFSRELSVMRNPLYSEKSENPTRRSEALLSYDFDGDLKSEIPVVSGFGDIVQITRCNLIPETEELSVREVVAANTEAGYSIAVSDKWEDGGVTATVSSSGLETVFYSVGGDGSSEELFSVAAFSSDEWEIGGASGDYSLIIKDGGYIYAYKNINTENNNSLSDDEIKTAFSLLPEGSVIE